MACPKNHVQAHSLIKRAMIYTLCTLCVSCIHSESGFISVNRNFLDAYSFKLSVQNPYPALDYLSHSLVFKCSKSVVKV